MADASDSKSDEGDLVWVQVPSPALRSGVIVTIAPFFYSIGKFFSDSIKKTKMRTSRSGK